MYARWFLFTLGKSETKAYIVNGLLMLATFFIFRNVIGVGARHHPREGGMDEPCTLNPRDPEP